MQIADNRIEISAHSRRPRTLIRRTRLVRVGRRRLKAATIRFAVGGIIVQQERSIDPAIDAELKSSLNVRGESNRVWLFPPRRKEQVVWVAPAHQKRGARTEAMSSNEMQLSVRELPATDSRSVRRLRFPLALSITSEPGHTAVSDDTVLQMFGAGATYEEALRDYTASLDELTAILMEEEVDDDLAQNERAQLAFIRALIAPE